MVYEAVVSDQNLRQRLIRAGRERVKDFSWEKCARETLKVLELVGAKAREVSRTKVRHER